MSHVEPERGGQRDPIGLGDPVSGKSLVEVVRDLRWRLGEARAFLKRYQSRYHDRPHARKLWNEVDRWMEETDEQ